MKKVMMLLMLGTFISFSVSASDMFKKEKLDEKLINNIPIKKDKKNVLPSLCFEFWLFTADCPDGSSFLASVDVFVVDCETGGVYGGGTVYTGDYEEECDSSTVESIDGSDY